MLASKNIIWSEEKFSLIDLLHSSHLREYPLLVKVVQGHYASTTEDNYDPEETFVFYGWGKQERVLAENANKVSISIPTSHEHKLSMYIYDAEQSKHRVTLPLSSVVSIYAPPVRVEFDRSVTSIFYVGSTLHSSDDFGPMLLKSSHLLEYVKCSPISQGQINVDDLHVLPTSLSLTCVAARALRDGLDLGKVLSGVQKETAFLMGTSMDHKLLGICGYSDLVPQKDGDYEYIVDIPDGPWGSPLGFKVSRKDRMTAHLPEAMANDPPRPTYPTETVPNDASKPPFLTFLENSMVDVREEEYLQPTTPPRFKPTLTEMESSRGRFPPKTVTRGPSNDSVINGDFMKELEAKLKITKSDVMVSEKPSFMGVPYPPPINTSPNDVHPPTPPRDPLQPPPTLQPPPFIPGRLGRQDSTPAPNQGPASIAMSTMAHGEVSSLSPTPSVGVRGRRITRLEDVPDDLSSLSVQEVCDCLRLLRLDNHVQQFTDNLVDGRLLLTCTANDLQTEFGFTTFRARQVERFVRDGWRPKMNG